MKKSILFVFVLAIFVGQSFGQDVVRPLTGWYYQNGNRSTVAAGDTLAGTTADSVTIGVLAEGGLYPSKVVIAIQFTNTTGDCDTVVASFNRGVRGLYQTDTPSDTLIRAITTTATVVRTFVTDATMSLTTAQAIANNKNGFDAINLRLVGSFVPSTARVKFVIRAFGVYPTK